MITYSCVSECECEFVSEQLTQTFNVCGRGVCECTEFISELLYVCRRMASTQVGFPEDCKINEFKIVYERMNEQWQRKSLRRTRLRR